MMRLYHGTTKDFAKPKLNGLGILWLTANPKVAAQYGNKSYHTGPVAYVWEIDLKPTAKVPNLRDLSNRAIRAAFEAQNEASRSGMGPWSEQDWEEHADFGVLERWGWMVGFLKSKGLDGVTVQDSLGALDIRHGSVALFKMSAIVSMQRAEVARADLPNIIGDIHREIQDWEQEHMTPNATIYGRKHTIRRGYLLVPQQMTGPGGKVYEVDLEYQVWDAETGRPVEDSRTVEGELHGSRLVVGDPHRDTQLFEYTVAAQPTSESTDYWRGYKAALGDRQWHKEGSGKKYYAQTQAWWDGYNQGHRDKRDPNAGYAPNPRKRPTKTRKHSFAGYDFTTDDTGTKVHRETIDASTRADYGYDHVGDGMVRMVPSGDVVSLEEAIRRLPKLGGSGGSNSGFRLNARRKPYEPPATLRLDNGLGAMRLGAERSKALGGATIETWKVYPEDTPLSPVAQIQIFQNRDLSWSTWSVSHRDRAYGAALAAARNGMTPNHAAVHYDLSQLDSDIDAALDHMSDFDVHLNKSNISVTDPMMIPMRQLGEYDDLSSWLDLDSGSDEQDVKDFRGARWAARAAQWASPQQMPPIVIVEAPSHVAIADGRGRVNYATAMGWDEIPAVIVTPAHEPNHAAVHYVWLIDYRGVPMDTEGPYGPMSIDRASAYARIGAKEGDHDRVVSIGRDIMAPGFEILRRYRRGTGERTQ